MPSTPIVFVFCSGTILGQTGPRRRREQPGLPLRLNVGGIPHKYVLDLSCTHVSQHFFPIYLAENGIPDNRFWRFQKKQVRRAAARHRSAARLDHEQNIQ